VTKVIRAIDPAGSDVFVEIGPGRGALTRPLAAQAGT
jgi:16S rRNA A1518/A1519 N6-dimethyltransferase RsmA/KsgA/DIM1 with predicted DNA glycosylase/AP lyase activity